MVLFKIVGVKMILYIVSNRIVKSGMSLILFILFHGSQKNSILMLSIDAHLGLRNHMLHFFPVRTMS